MKIVCGDQEIPLHEETKTLYLSVSGSIGCIGVDGNDLYDLGLRHSEIVKGDHRAEIHIGNLVIKIERRELVGDSYIPYVEAPDA